MPGPPDHAEHERRDQRALALEQARERKATPAELLDRPNHQSDQQCLLFAGGSVGGGNALEREDHGKIGQVRPVEKEVTTPTFRAKEVLGTKVSITGGTEIGTVEDLVFDEADSLPN